MKKGDLILAQENGHRRGDPPAVQSTRFRKFFLIGMAALGAIVFALAPEVFLLFFCCVLFAVMLVAFCRLIESRRSMERKWSLTIVVAVLLVLAGLGSWLTGYRLYDQFSRFASELPRAIENAKSEVESWSLGPQLLRSIERFEQEESSHPGIFSRASSILSSAGGVLVQLVIVIFVGLYLAANPGLYMNAFSKLFPVPKRERIVEILSRSGDILRWWLCGRLLLMGSNGLITALGLWLMGVPLAITLGIISALLNFIPNFGPIIVAIPAILIALLESPSTAIQVAAFYLIYQMFDGYVLTPLVQRRTVSLPPALILMVQVLFGVLFGSLGVLIAVPFAAVALVFFEEVYQKEILQSS